LNAQLIGRVALESEGAGENALGGVAELRDIVIAHSVQRVIVAPRAVETEVVLEVITTAKAIGVKVSVLPRMLEVIGSSVEFDHVDGATLLGVQPFGLSPSSALIKRGTDVVGAVVGLALLSPLLVTIAVAIRLSSRGPALFRQVRIGQDGEPFLMVKFRSMTDGAHALRERLEERNEAAEGLFKISDDP
jgi:hypothetical protein